MGDINISTGDARELSRALPYQSVDLIFTDPIYDDMEAYHWLALAGKRLLKPEGMCLVFLGTKFFSRVLTEMCPPLHYRWLLTEIQTFSGIKAGTSVISSRHNDCLWLELEPEASRAYKRIWDVSHVSKKARPAVPTPRNGFKWSKHPNTIKRWLEAFTKPDDLVLDPFTGHGTIPAICKALGRRCIAFEIDPERAEIARTRTNQTASPLFSILV